MAESIVGTVGVVWGLATGATGTGIGTSIEMQSASFAAESEQVEYKNATGQTIGKVFFNQKHTLTLEVIPTGATVSAARSSNIIPAPGAIVTITDTADTEVSGTHSGKYLCVRASKQKSNTDITKITMELEQYVENDIAVAISAS